MKGSRVLIISLVGALIAMMLVYGYISSRENALMRGETPIKVVVALRDIPEDTRLDDSMVEIREVPKIFVQPGAVSDVTDVYDRVLQIGVMSGAQILEDMVRPSEGETLAKKIPSGMRAVSISANEVTAVAGLIQPGNFVDVMLTVETGIYDERGVMQPEQTITKTVLQNILVLAANQFSSKRAYQRSKFKNTQKVPGTHYSMPSAEQEGGKQLRTLTLALTPEDAQKITLAQEVGSVTVALRSSWSEEQSVALPFLSAKKLMGVDKKILRKSTPSWVEIRGSQMINP